MKETIKIKIHSFIDLITNSSTELFIIDRSYGVDIINEAIQAKFPGIGLSAYLTEPQWFYYESEDELERSIERLRERGYQIIEPKEKLLKPKEIHISCERGEMTEEFKQYITEVFNGEYETE
jgi:malate/lactate dehydrogenase